MREIITIQLGQCGNNVGGCFWDVISNEHAIDPGGNFYGSSPLQLERINVYYNEAGRRWFARAIAVDTDKSSVQKLKSLLYGNLISPDNVISGREGTGNNFAKGFHTEGAELMDVLIDVMRREVENTDCLQGFKIIHSVGGGTGSGMGSLLLRHLADEYPQNLKCSFTIVPSPIISNVVVEPYNSILSFPHLISHTHETFCIDNDALNNICMGTLELPSASFADMNQIIAYTMSGVTTCFRFPGQLNSSLHKLYVNMVPFPNLHFFIPGFAPFFSRQRMPYRKCSVPELVMQIFSGRNILADIDMRAGKFLTVAAIFRGLMSTKEIDVLMRNIHEKNIEFFVDWIPNNIKTAICDIPPKGLRLSSTFLGNTSSVGILIKRCLNKYYGMFRKKAYLHWYLGEGMEESEFIEAGNLASDLIDEYDNICIKTV